ncbi:hypothetical protein PSEUBRA_004412 [Kalmanozyma brasiliensis GHG001]|uniref:uncharacterized protein n=1 Tax=Kalmanozyma brasiliensis (strain GHG001) TaxID=1365824 RepID=UPI002867B3CD|nr:uncharacterized protein PSEUBRA_004412 [Kalmanozyma brasiliensis GHG001]KAF6767377.1 hypothetical protein PSEUBRA_004412 [Kalmanozyma brasiliensis GHG001]
MSSLTYNDILDSLKEIEQDFLLERKPYSEILETLSEVNTAAASIDKDGDHDPEVVNEVRQVAHRISILASTLANLEAASQEVSENLRREVAEVLRRED